MRKRIIIYGIMGVIFSLILAGYANDQQALDTETKLKQTKIMLKIDRRLSLTSIMVFLTEKAKCNLSFQIKDDGEQAGSAPATGRTQDLDVGILKTNNNVYVASMAIYNVSAFDLMDNVVKKAGLTWRIAGNGVVVVVPDDATYSGIEKDYEELKSPLKSLYQVKSCVCKEYENKSNDYTRVISDTKNYYVLASPWIGQRLGERPAYHDIIDKNGGHNFYESIYIVRIRPPFNIKEIFDGPDAGAPALRVSPRGKVDCPVWDRLGERIAYVRVSEDKKEGHIVILNVKTGRETVYSGLGMRPDPPGGAKISWDESGRLITFLNAKAELCLLDLKDQTFRGIWECPFPKSVSLSPDGKYVCFIMSWLTTLAEITDGRRLTASNQEQTVKEPEGSSPVLCVDTYNTDMDDWRVTVVNIQKKEIKSIGRQRYNLGILPSLLWMPDSKAIVIRTFAPGEKEKCVLSYYLYRVAENDLVPYSGDGKLPYSQSWRYWGVKGVQGDSVMEKTN
ncbi:hypothetical protein ACFLQL_00910 [Verrucomicrobiota bacterium]